ncbi:LacI family DNA-binding transcriptional regulator [Paenibacillus arenilitoris]|uniref:LacI family DNA-binding transcriptional regulator n=1 Tax=Paenibacillus arenilitoris TaxID=2772299 RepID=A0A927CJ46_9BACL|nr:LacI family DNA-binding transcriptional regulator [Paenibacillus arenilitoris]MBD2867667.1 LacI family DNA-binding transcriptional regulator [Paenibacillus arenilitoris]
MGKEINSTEIARLAGVSRSTVSRVINNYANVPEKTKEKVMSVIRRHNYYPNLSAQVLAGKRARTIGLFMIDAGRVSGDMISSMLLARIIESASSRGYYVLTHIVRDPRDGEEARMMKESFYQRRIDGGVFIGAANDEPIIEELIAEGFTVAIVDQHRPGHREPNRIVFNFDNETGVGQAIDYLARLGHTKIGMINGDMQRYSGPSKWKGFQAAMARNGLPVVSKWILPGDFNEASGCKAMKELLASGTELPTAIFAANDSVAFGAIRALQKAGIRVPDDLSVVGFDDHTLSAHYNPALTTIRVDFAAMMDQLTYALISSIENGPEPIGTVAVGTELVIRASCRRVEAK